MFLWFQITKNYGCYYYLYYEPIVGVLFKAKMIRLLTWCFGIIYNCRCFSSWRWKTIVCPLLLADISNRYRLNNNNKNIFILPAYLILILTIFFFTVSDFTQELSQMYEQHAAELQLLVTNFRKKNTDLRKDRYAAYIYKLILYTSTISEVVEQNAYITLRGYWTGKIIFFFCRKRRGKSRVTGWK